MLSTLFLLAYKVIDLSQKILYTWQVAGVGAGHIVNVFNHRLFAPISFATRTGCGEKLRLTLLGGPTRLLLGAWSL